MSESALVTEGDVGPLTAGFDFVHFAPLGNDGIGATYRADESAMVCIGRQQSGGHGGAADYERPAGPPDVELVDRRVAGHGAAFAEGFHGDFVDGEPVLDEATGGGRHWYSCLRHLRSRVVAL